MSVKSHGTYQQALYLREEKNLSICKFGNVYQFTLTKYKFNNQAWFKLTVDLLSTMWEAEKICVRLNQM